MDTIECIALRRTIPVVKNDPVPRSLVEQLLAAAVVAPNHHKVRPWRFVVFQGEGRLKLGGAFANALKARQSDLPDSALEKERGKALRAPLVIAVGVDKCEDPRLTQVENICAVAAACENLLLAANALGLVGIWRTGVHAEDEMIKAFLGFDPTQPIIAFLYLGYPQDEAFPVEGRPSFEDRTVWVD